MLTHLLLQDQMLIIAVIIENLVVVVVVVDIIIDLMLGIFCHVFVVTWQMLVVLLHQQLVLV